jgi:hypothetical protein
MYGHRLLGSLIVTATLLAPGLSQAAVARQARRTVTVRVYDRPHKDYHVWDAREDQAYRQYLTDQHMKYRRFSTLKHNQQNTYWNSRHDQTDHR